MFFILKILAIKTITFYCTYVFPFLESIYKSFSHYLRVATNKYVEPNPLKGWSCLVYLNDKNKYAEYYNDEELNASAINASAINASFSTLWIQRLPETGFYLYNNNIATTTTTATTTTATTTTHEKSSVYFFTITLIQNNLNQEIKLKKDEYIIGNQLLSRLHILRYINYNNITGFAHDKPYIIEIMDNKFNIFQINNTHYILLDGKHKYTPFSETT